ncbi:hypothetical protein [Methylomonas sp. ZR1]|uniref:hypothetical protein n=1 Tax=Methylomonas sp. ZR1 TaxID=1797072 RepID=UPI00149095D1|nr:hypothetical protein [Methylomonas sp. ZR1]NOV29228.1 hypothetical protein [Methylomonas sp. ZR1]
MDNVLIFTPKFEKDAKQNLKDFIGFSQKLPALNDKLVYSSNYWKGAVNFTKIGVSSKNREPRNQLDESIIPFAKAYVTYSQSLKKAKAFNEMKAIRALEQVMLKTNGTVDVNSINAVTLDQAAQVIRESYEGQAIYHGGLHLEKLQDFLVSKKIVKPFTWINPLNRHPDDVDKVGEVGATHREKKLPDENALLALAEIFALGEDNLSKRDIFTSSAIAILLTAPARASELFYLKVDCLHEDVDRQGNKVLGIKWYSGKGYGYEVEWVPSSMENTVREAVRRLKNLSEPARKFAKSLEDNKASSTFSERLLNFPYVPYTTGDDVSVKWSEGLFTLHAYEFRIKGSVNTRKLWMPHIDTLNEDLEPTKKKKKDSNEPVNVKSIFQRHEYLSYKITSHQIRHLLSTIAKVNGMDTALLTKWAGRANEKHNRVYNHTPPEHYNKQLSLISGSHITSHSNLPIIEIVKPNTIQEINTSASLTLHQTEFGVCIHDYIISPCSKHRQCITCPEQVCLKGDNVKLERLKTHLEAEQSLLISDRAAMVEGTIGADRHYNKRLESIKICSELIEKLTDDTLPDGTLIKLSSASNMSHLDKALDINNKKRLPKIEKNRDTGVQTVIRGPQALNKLKMLRNS